jgi:hypothetical protein
MIISIYYVVECQHRHMRADQATLHRLHRDLAIGMLCVNGTFTAGFLAGRPWGGDRRHINAMYFHTPHASRPTPHAPRPTLRSPPPRPPPPPLAPHPSPHAVPTPTLPLTPTRCFIISTVCFFSMLTCIDRMLVSTQQWAGDRMPGVAWQAPPDTLPSRPRPDLRAHLQPPPPSPTPPATSPPHTTFTAPTLPQ